MSFNIANIYIITLIFYLSTNYMLKKNDLYSYKQGAAESIGQFRIVIMCNENTRRLIILISDFNS